MLDRERSSEAQAFQDELVGDMGEAAKVMGEVGSEGADEDGGKDQEEGSGEGQE